MTQTAPSAIECVAPPSEQIFTGLIGEEPQVRVANGRAGRGSLGSSLLPRVSVRDVTSVTDVTCHAVTNVTNKSESVATG